MTVEKVLTRKRRWHPCWSINDRSFTPHKRVSLPPLRECPPGIDSFNIYDGTAVMIDLWFPHRLAFDVVMERWE